MTTGVKAENPVSPCLAELQNGASRWVKRTPTERAQLAVACLASLGSVADEWVRASCVAKQIDPASAQATEEITSGPMAVARYLQMISATLNDLANAEKPTLPRSFRYRKSDDRFLIPIFPSDQLFDRLAFPFLKIEAVAFANDRPEPEFDTSTILNARPSVCLVLGAGNVSAVAATDALTRIFQDGQTVLLKMNPVLSYMTPVFEQAFRPLVDNKLLRVVDGDAASGSAVLHDDRVDNIQITGSVHSHDAIVWGQDAEENRRNNTPVLTKPILSELGNVTPWIVVPGQYSQRQLQFQARNIAASITNNAGFNCLATRVVVTHEKWNQREQFLTLLRAALQETPRRYAYYPGAIERFEKYSGSTPPSDGCCPWVLLENESPQKTPQLFCEESFTCVCAEAPLVATDEADFLAKAAEFANHQLYGTLCASVTIPAKFQSRYASEWNRFIADLKYGTIGVNQWTALAYALMTPPWGGYPGATLDNIQSGIGWVHNTYMIKDVEKSVLTGPLTMHPKPIWFANHKRPTPIAKALLRLYLNPGYLNLLRLLPHALRG